MSFLPLSFFLPLSISPSLVLSPSIYLSLSLPLSISPFLFLSPSISPSLYNILIYIGTYIYTISKNELNEKKNSMFFVFVSLQNLQILIQRMYTYIVQHTAGHMLQYFRYNLSWTSQIPCTRYSSTKQVLTMI